MSFLSGKQRNALKASIRDTGLDDKFIHGVIGDSHLDVTLTTKTTLTKATHFTHRILRLDPGGGARTVVLPTEADMDGYMGIIVNAADAAETLTVKEDGDSTTIATIDQDEACLLFCDGTNWWGIILTSSIT